MYLVTSGRYQTPHVSHMEFFEYVLSLHEDAELVVCVLQSPVTFSDDDLDVLGDASFARLSKLAADEAKNPLPNWHRFKLMSLALAANENLRGRSHVMMRSRPELSWTGSVVDLPEDRVWVFNTAYDQEFSTTKAEYYRKRGETVEPLSFTSTADATGTEIRERASKGEDVSRHLPDGCHDYFDAHCRHYYG